MERISLVAEGRSKGKGIARRLRVAGKIPGVLYGKKIDPVSISVDERELVKATKKTMNILIDLTVEDGDSGLALIRDYQADPFKRQFKHVDFQAITLDEKLDIEVPINLVGISAGVKEDGGVVEQSRRTLQISAFPDKIPSAIEIDISELNIGDSIHANEITLPEGVEFPHRTDFTLVAIVPPAKVEETVVAAEGEVSGEGEVPAEGEAPAEGGEKAAEGGEKAAEEKK